MSSSDGPWAPEEHQVPSWCKQETWPPLDHAVQREGPVESKRHELTCWGPPDSCAGASQAPLQDPLQATSPQKPSNRAAWPGCSQQMLQTLNLVSISRNHLTEVSSGVGYWQGFLGPLPPLGLTVSILPGSSPRLHLAGLITGARRLMAALEFKYSFDRDQPQGLALGKLGSGG